MSEKNSKKRITILSKALGDLQNRYEDKINELSLLRQWSDLFAYVFDLHEACQKIVDLIYNEFLPDNCSLMLLDENTNEIELCAIHSKTSFAKDKERTVPPIGKRFKIGEGAAGWALEQKKITYVPDTSIDERFVTYDDTRVDIKTLLCVPLLSQDKPEGVINISYCSITTIPRERIHFLNIFMHHVGLAVGNIRLFSELSEANRYLKEANENLHITLAELHKTRKYIMHTEELAGLSLFAAGIAHEFNNIFAAIMGYSELSLISDDLKEHKKTFKTIINSSNRATKIIDNLLDFSGRRSMENTEADINAELHTILNLTKPELKQTGIKIRKYLGTLPKIICDINQIGRVFLHLISNARDAMEERGGILTIKTKKKDNCAEIKISDTGKGIEADLIDNIFDPFVTTKGAFGGGKQPGTGLGLSVVYGIIKSHGGDISVTSEVNSGTTVTILLPLTPSQKKPARKDTKRAEDRSKIKTLGINRFQE